MKQKKYIITAFISIFFFLFATISAYSQINSINRLTKNNSQYSKSEWDIQLVAQWDNPYSSSDIALDMHIITPSGQKQVLPCFYVSGNSQSKSQWKARYTPQEVGGYSYLFNLSKNGKIISSSKSEQFSVSSSDIKKGFIRSNNNWSFQFDNGEYFRGIGENICWESRDIDDSKFFKKLHEDKRFNYDFMLKKLANNGGNFVRLWMIYWNLPVDWKTVSNNSRYSNSTDRFNQSGIDKMDKLVELCDSLGIYMMLALESHVGYMDEGWETSSYNIKNGGYAKTPSEFFSNEKAKEQYKNKLRFMIARWGYSPSIGAWEFFNEVDNAMFSRTREQHIESNLVVKWHSDMSDYFKKTDPFKHLVTTSISHREIDGLESVSSIDFNQRHIYGHTQEISKIISENVEKFNKTFVVGEFGYDWDWSKNFNEFGDEMDSDFKRGLWYGLFSSTPILPMSWWWEFFEDRGMMKYFANVNEINKNMLKAGSGEFKKTLISSNDKDLTILSVNCGSKTYIYIFNSTETEKTISLNNDKAWQTNNTIQLYDCDNSKYNIQNISVDKNILQLSKYKLASKTDIVLILSNK